MKNLSLRFSKSAPILAALLSMAQLHAADANATAWTATAALAAKETYDSNVFTQNVTDRAYHHSLVSSVAPSIAVDYTLSPLLKSSVSYSPEINVFHSEHGEDNIKHNAALSVSGKDGDSSYAWTSTLLAIDGSKTGPTYSGPGGAAVIGGIDVRDRRNANVYRSNFKVNFTEGDFLIRPVATAYVHAFHTYQRTSPGYENFVNRSEFVGGLDVGYKVTPALVPLVSIRYGKQDQENLLGVVNNYSNRLTRALVGLEGSPASWVKFSLLFGEDYRRFTDGTVPVDFPKNKTKFYSDSTITLTPSLSDTITLLYRRFLQPAFTGRNAYEDITCDTQWKHVFNQTFNGGLGFKEYDGFFENGNRHDHIYTYNINLGYEYDKATSIKVAFIHDGTQAEAPGIDTSGRDFFRNQVSLSVSHTF